MNHEFRVYNASAGSGKTYTLVKEQISALLQNQNPYAFESLLAITFTNKAANEMKNRLLSWLANFASDNELENPILLQLSEELKTEPKILQTRSQEVLSRILHQYSRLSVSTIDKFNLRLMKSFAKDFGISANFSVELDSEKLLKESIDLLFQELREDDQLTKILVEISLQKLETDQNWLLDYEIINVFNQLFFDQHQPYLEKLSSFSLSDLNAFRKRVFQKVYAYENQMLEDANEILQLIEGKSLKLSDFFSGASRGIPKFFSKIANRQFEFATASHQKIIDEKKYASAKASPETESTIESIFPLIEEKFESIQIQLTTYFLWKNVSKTVPVLSLMNEVNKSLSTVKEENQTLFISDFNRLISSHLKQFPAAFIYEKIGNRYHHLFIDEFQDTSDLQWNNLFPLIENARSVSDEILLVGDVKQSIYRWRGGNPSLMIDISKWEDVNVNRLEKNWRSAKAVVEFNNELFQHFSQQLINPEHSKIYSQSGQETNEQRGGYVQVDFYPHQEYDEQTLNLTKTHIESAIENGFDFGEITILHRTKLQGKRIAEFLSEQNVPILSDESLLLTNSLEVQTIISLLHSVNQDFDSNLFIEFLFNLKQLNRFDSVDFSQFCIQILNCDLKDKLNLFKTFDLDLSFIHNTTFSLYDFVETAIRALHFSKKSDAYLQFFMDLVLEFSDKQGANLTSFLEHWNRVEEKASIRSPENVNAVRLMTIHKSKGLEFPVVILPYADWNSKDSGIWIPIEDEQIPFFYVNSTKNLEYASDELQSRIEKEHEMRQLDDLNLLYVATTRAKEQLYIISKSPSKTSENFISNSLYSFASNHSDLDVKTFTMGAQERIQTNEKNEGNTETIDLNSSPWQEKIRISKDSLVRWEQKNTNLEFGNLIHQLMAEVYTKNDVDLVIKKANLKGIVSKNESEFIQNTINQIINHKELKPYFTKSYEIFNERDCLTENGEIIRPDRVVINDEECVIVDYKTGKYNVSHQNQIDLYARFFKNQGYTNVKTILVYLSDSIETKIAV